VNAYDDSPPRPWCGGYDCIVDDEDMCQARTTEDEIRRDCDAQRPELTETFVSPHLITAFWIILSIAAAFTIC